MEDAHKNTLAARNACDSAAPPLAETRRRIGEWLEAPRIQRGIIALVVINAITVGLETVPAVWREAGWLLGQLDRVLLSVFVMEIALKLFAHGGVSSAVAGTFSTLSSSALRSFRLREHCRYSGR